MVRNKDKAEFIRDVVKRVLGYMLLAIMLGIYLLHKEFDLYLFLFPALVLGRDISKLQKK